MLWTKLEALNEVGIERSDHVGTIWNGSCGLWRTKNGQDSPSGQCYCLHGKLLKPKRFLQACLSDDI
jgi:hypothetical protein